MNDQLGDGGKKILVFVGTGEFAVPSLQSLHAAGHQILVITQPDRPSGRGMKMTPSPIKVAAQELGVEVYSPERIREKEALDKIKLLNPDFLVCADYGQIIPQAMLAIPKFASLNIHPSLLPRHRGAAPVAYSILSGDTITGVTIISMDEHLDTGPILLVSKTTMGESEDAEELTARLALIGAEMIKEAIERGEAIEPVEQDHEASTLAPRLKKIDGEMNWEAGTKEIDRRVRALSPWPGVTLPTVRGRVKVLKGHIEDLKYVLDVVQVPGKKPGLAKQVLGDFEKKNQVQKNL